MRRVLSLLAGIVLASGFVWAGGQGESGALSGTIRIAGSSTVYPITVAMAEEFNRVQPGVQIAVQSTGTGGGFKNFFIPGKTEINDASRPIKESELEQVRAQGDDALEFQVAIDAVTVVVNPQADWVDDVTIEQLRHIWRPDDPAQKWSDVDPSWPDEPFELYGPTSASGTFDFFTEKVMGEEDLSRSDYQGTEEDNTIVQAVSGSKYALGYFGMAYYLENTNRVKALKVNGVAPSLETARTYEYPLSRPIFIYVRKSALARPEVAAFVRFYIERTNSDLISEIGYVPVTDEVVKENLAKLEKAIAEVSKK
ncbi:phosphate binding protein [Spirochaeta thermophila DSM 6578]|uniref:Phosphate-binding protein n=1 Tax=Winmispira thermophila (strain ATCC 700085 / DSM 6578 / Z-1203) TaxID=869211 RepID=G0G9T2_WINT7|nr:PstS family phosphate ABC transporter substrate-binding protein [Spirochaeta thermophila]AEJ60832.1 phosphate binding protein [Spirochaeta thermophila DSM 6578]